MRYPRRRTTFAILDARRLELRRRISLKGDFSFDAISPDGRLMYLVEYNPREIGEYQVRAYDLRARRLLRRPVVDPREPDEEMYGLPVTRVAAATAAGRTRSTQPEHPFVHALDTARRTAVLHRPGRPEAGVGRDARSARRDARGDWPPGPACLRGSTAGRIA